MQDNSNRTNIPTPVGALGIIGMAGCEELTQKVDNYLTLWRKERHEETHNNQMFLEYVRDSYQIRSVCPRFGTGEAKGVLKESIRGDDLYILVDVFNYGVTYTMYGQEVPMSPDDHYSDLKRIIAATGGKARRITVIMPMLYEGRQHRRTSRESLDCALFLQELYDMGVESIITFDAHDARVQNAVPLSGFENIQPTYQFLKAMKKNIEDLNIDKNHLMIVSPDEGGMSRCMYYSSVLGVDLGMFYKRRDYSQIINGRNPIVAHEFLGDNVDGKDVIIIDDMISSGDSVLDIANKLKEKGASRIFICTSFGLFCEGLEHFDKAYEEGKISKVFTTNLIYRSPELKKREWYVEVDMSKYIAYIIDFLNHDESISELLNPVHRINRLLGKE
ncbi:ribose-phosphate pyrophosphokinase [Paludicola sp. MB14-C6]|uniref:ribose-phosphate pyrophosphokinase n=1 Tax=Paludihabitans sp. MB14-C6 TaxID=3070656 RepID=UPI0027DBB787|nr:ribose-phosphate pyrophosphokinase [Paludicola sp. MB14-C6]WMJ21849.1 ribose-phosphate pyrophosphokinase [Paludicola sp. MB14-C6]